jgi:hypothetical protein
VRPPETPLRLPARPGRPPPPPVVNLVCPDAGASYGDCAKLAAGGNETNTILWLRGAGRVTIGAAGFCATQIVLRAPGSDNARFVTVEGAKAQLDLKYMAFDGDGRRPGILLKCAKGSKGQRAAPSRAKAPHGRPPPRPRAPAPARAAAPPPWRPAIPAAPHDPAAGPLPARPTHPPATRAPPTCFSRSSKTAARPTAP